MLNKAQIDDLIYRNAELLKSLDKRIEEEEKFTGTRYDITINPDSQLYQVVETHEDLVVGDVVFGWRCVSTFKKIPPLFKNTPSHIVQNYEDLKLLQEGMTSIFESAFQFMGEVL